MKRLCILLSFFVSLPSFSDDVLPNYWIFGGNMGVYEYTLTNDVGDRFVVTCDLGFSEDQHLSSVSLYQKNRGVLGFIKNKIDGASHEENEVSVDKMMIIVIDGQQYFIPSLMTSSDDKSGSELFIRELNDWYRFSDAIKNASYFEVYLDNKLSAIFKPSLRSAQENASGFKECKRMRE
ncbi:hypothetical protein HPC38_02785 [Pasteurellaceae bacterium HPA106]|uniref:hypothetical protein n=1 Tax=Spirabiliibacterium pneumoniae TaxID=221400 RepID=UPI001AAC4E2B|nr:hypothetical protein [Spirabiliibacterium pneumoniae]MBE2895805.1 hypothetical protein [Spirabiliibacterium pneumoniae]